MTEYLEVTAFIEDREQKYIMGVPLGVRAVRADRGESTPTAAYCSSCVRGSSY